jgi:hypothetical protein
MMVPGTVAEGMGAEVMHVLGMIFSVHFMPVEFRKLLNGN